MDEIQVLGHSLLSPSAANRWFNCQRSVRACEKFPDEGSVFASEGTEAHRLCQFLLNTAIGRHDVDPRHSMEYYDVEMQRCCEEYVQYVLEKIAQYSARGMHPMVFIEQRVDLRRYVPESQGTADCLIVAGNEVLVVDFKYGMVRVPATSLQLRLYALGACEMFGMLYDFATVRMAVFQPRISSVDETEMEVAALYDWAANELAPRARLAFDGAGEFAPGDWCRFCRIRRNCRALAMHELELAKYGNVKPELLTDEEIADVLCRVDELISWAKSVQEYAEEQALRGHEFPGFKVVEGRSYRRFTDEDAVAERVLAEGKDPWAPQKILSLTDIEKLLGKKKFARLLSDLVVRPAGKPALVPASDPRDPLVLADAVYSEVKDELKGNEDHDEHGD